MDLSGAHFRVNAPEAYDAGFALGQRHFAHTRDAHFPPADGESGDAFYRPLEDEIDALAATFGRLGTREYGVCQWGYNDGWEASEHA